MYSNFSLSLTTFYNKTIIYTFLFGCHSLIDTVSMRHQRSLLVRNLRMWLEDPTVLFILLRFHDIIWWILKLFKIAIFISPRYHLNKLTRLKSFIFVAWTGVPIKVKYEILVVSSSPWLDWTNIYTHKEFHH